MWLASQLIGYGVQATDDRIGTIDDLLFDDREWTVRWAAVDTGSWLSGRLVLLPASSIGPVDPRSRTAAVELTRRQVEQSPGIETDQPVSRQLEADLQSHYGLTPYWSAGIAYAPVGAFAAPPVGAPATAQGRRPAEGDPHLRSANEVTGYYIQGSDDSVGHVEDFLVDENGWTVRYMLVDTKNWWPGKKVLVSPRWIREVSWEDREVAVGLSRQQVKDSPEYQPERFDRAYEERLHQHYGFPGYWG